MPISDRCRATLAAVALILAGPLAADTATGLPEIQTWRTDNGARVLFLADDSIPMVAARVTFSAGAARDDDRPGQARLTAEALLAGAGERDADAIAEGFDRYGAEIDTGAARDMAWLSLTTLAAADQREPVSDLAGEVLADPAFPGDDVERLIGQQRTELRRERQSPGAIASRRFWETAYEGHPYASNPLGTNESLDELGPDALEAFHERYYVGDNATVALAGDIDRDEAEAMAEALVGGLPAGEAPAAIPPAPELDEDVTVRESFPSSQVHITIGRPGFARDYTDEAAFDVANHVFGAGSFTNRLFREVREKRGLVYGVRSRATPMAAEGPFRIGLQTRGDQEEEALRVVRDELDRFLADGPDADETEAAVDNITGGFPLSIDANSDLVGQLSVIGFYDLPLDRLEAYPRAVADVDADAAHDAFTGVVGDRPRVTVIVGGDRNEDD